MFFRRFASTLPPTIRTLLWRPAEYPNSSTVTVSGWIKSVRKQKTTAFAEVTDGSTTAGLQAIFIEENLGAAERLTNGTSVKLTGLLVESPGPGQDRELLVEDVEIVGKSDPHRYPIQKKALSIEYLRDHCHLRSRTDAIASMLRLRNASMKSLQRYFESEGFIHVHTPILTSNDCEGAGETFRVISSKRNDTPSKTTEQWEEFFSRPAHLTVSGQLHLEALTVPLSRVFTLSPCFRSDRSMTNRHLAEFWMLEAEWAFVDGVHEVCEVVQAAIRSVLEDVWQAETNEDINALWKEKSTRKLMALLAAQSDKAWELMTYTDAVRELCAHHSRSSSSKFQFEPAWGRPLQSEHERWLAEEVAKGPLFVTDYPASLKPFYMRANEEDNGRTVACFDLLVPHVGELAGGSLREERPDKLVDAIKRAGLNGDEYEWYLDLRRFGAAKSGGFGLGFERLISWLGGIENVRECIAMPRWTGRIPL